MAHTMDLQIRNSKTILANDHEIFSGIAERRQNILRELRDAFEVFLNKTENFAPKEFIDVDSEVGTNVAAGSGVAVVGIILAAVTQGMVFDITGGVLTALGFIVAGVTLGLQRGKVIRNYKAEMEKGRKRLEQDLKLELYSYIESLKTRMDEQFRKFDELLQLETTEVSSLTGELDKIRIDLSNIRKRVES